MIQKFSPVLLLATMVEQIEKTGLRCYDVVPDDAESPFYSLELTQTRPADTKTMYITEFLVNVHVIAPAGSSVALLEALTDLEEVFTEPIPLPTGYYLANQISNGVLVVKTDETGERHAVEQWSFKIAYGLKTKGV